MKGGIIMRTGILITAFSLLTLSIILTIGKAVQYGSTFSNVHQVSIALVIIVFIIGIITMVLSRNK